MREPRPLIPLDYARPATVVSRWDRPVNFLLIASWCLCMLMWLLVVAFTVKVVAWPGPLLFVLGAATTASGISARRWIAVGVGTAHCGLCLLFFGLVALMDWTPSDADRSFTVMGLGYVLFITTPTLMAWKHSGSPR